MSSKYTEEFLLMKLREIRAAIAEAQKLSGRCDANVGISLNALRDVILREVSIDPHQLGQTIPKLQLHISEWFSVAPADALRLHDALVALVSNPSPPPEGEPGELRP